MNWDDFHIIKNGKINLVYHSSSFNMITISDLYSCILELLKSGVSIYEIAYIYGCTSQDISLVANYFHKLHTSNNTDLKYSIVKKKKFLGRITLHVSNDCNLRCKYCFAKGGSYQQPCGMMNIETAKSFVDFCVNCFDKIDQIVFFGGEPMLNPPIMKFVCDKFYEYFESGKSSFIPDFGIITNGTILTDEILQFVKKYISVVTVSIDGPKEINDVNRVYKNGKGSYENISKFINTIRDKTSALVQYESTYTQCHINAGYTHENILTALKKEFHIDGFVINDIDVYSDAINKYWNDTSVEYLEKTNFEYMPDNFWDILRAVVRRETIQICSIVNNIFAVGVEGDIYPCHLLNGSDKKKLGNVSGINIFNSSLSYESFYSKIQFKKNKKCKRCWARKLCSGCAVQKFYNKEIEEFDTEPNKDLCELTKQHLEQILLMIATIRTNTRLWSSFVEKVNK